MKLPGGKVSPAVCGLRAKRIDAIVEISKLRDYCLNPHHPRGRYKARVFLSALGLAPKDADFLRAALIESARTVDAIAGISDEYRDRYSVDFEVTRGIAMPRFEAPGSCFVEKAHRG
jgi:hypothetical protein